jgi:hypothetical protein
VSTNPATLRMLGAYWTERGGVNLGVVGDGRHTKGYHLGEDRIYDGNGPGLGSDDYSVQTPRDRIGLSEAASAIDLGKLGGSLTNLYAFSAWLVSRCQANAEGTSDIREVIYSDDGIRVLRWDRQRGYSSAPRLGEADDSHLTHTHISYYRDSELRDKVATFAAYWAPPDTSTEDAMQFSVKDSTSLGTATVTRNTYLRTVNGEKVWISAGSQRFVYAKVTLLPDEPAYLVNHADRAHFLIASAATVEWRSLGDTKQTVTVTVSDGRPPIVITEV